MPRRIFLSETDINSLHSLLKKHRCITNNNSININSTILALPDANKATIFFSTKAWIKMYSLINSYTGEVEWHGVVQRINDTSFIVTDILVFPHYVTSTTVTSDQQEYEEWLDSLDDDTLNSLRFHGHSHVNMGVTPSGVDDKYRRDMINNFSIPSTDSNDFYIFFIGNKNGATNTVIYDLKNNIAYANNEIDIKVKLDENECLDEFLSNAKKLVSQQPSYSYGKGYHTPQYASYNQQDSKKTNNRNKQSNQRQYSNINEEYETIEEYYDSLYERKSI